MASLREQVRDRAEDRCEYCRLPQSLTILPHEQDHVRAQKHGGESSLDNLCWACAQRNAAKGPNVAGHDPATGQLVPLFNPRTEVWGEHFCWNGPELIGRTAEGRTTIAVLGINLPGRVAHRRMLIEAELFLKD